MKILKFITTLLFSTSLLFCCKQKSSKDITYNESRELVPNPEGYNKDTFIVSGANSIGDERWGFNKILNDPKTSQLAKDIFNNNWTLENEEPLQFLENLHGKDKEARPFYFRIVTNSYKQSDGAYSEGLGNAGYEYVREYPDEFSNYFVGLNAFTENDLQTWAEIVMLEFEIISENEYQNPIVKNYVDAVKKNCHKCSLQQKEIIEKFSSYLNTRWAEVLKRIEQ